MCEENVHWQNSSRPTIGWVSGQEKNEEVTLDSKLKQLILATQSKGSGLKCWHKNHMNEDPQ